MQQRRYSTDSISNTTVGGSTVNSTADSTVSSTVSSTISSKARASATSVCRDSQDGGTTAPFTVAGDHDRFSEMRRLDDLAWNEFAADAEIAYRNAGQAIDLCESLGGGQSVHRSLTIVARMYGAQHKHKKALHFLNRALPSARSSEDFYCLEMIYRIKAEVSVRLQDLPEARRNIELCRAVIRAHDMNPLDIDMIQAQVLVYDNKLAAGVEICEKVLRQAEASNQPQQAARAATHLTALYRIVGDFNKVRSVGKIATELNIQEGYMKNQIAVYMSLAESAIRRDDYEPAVELYDKAQRIAETNGVPADRAMVLLNRCAMYLHREDCKSAEKVLNAARVIAQELRDKSVAAVLMMDGLIALKRKEYTTACKHFNASLETEILMSDFDCWQVHLGLATAYEHLNKAQDALRHHKIYVEQFERSQGHGVQQRIALIERRFESQRTRHAKELLQCKISELHAEVDAANAELADLALTTAQRTIGLQSLRENISHELERAPKTSQAFLEDLRASVEGLMTEQESWQPFNEQFNKVHSGFANRLAQRHPNLSPSEMHICALMLVGLRSKDIAGILHVSLHTVNTHRQNIRRKMKLPRGGNLGNYLTGL